MADDRPLTSEEMIRKARESLSQASRFPTPEVEEATADLEPADEPDPDDPKPLATARAQRPHRTLRKSRPPLPADPFFGSPRRSGTHSKPQPIVLIIAVVVAVLGIALFLAAVAANAP